MKKSIVITLMSVMFSLTASSQHTPSFGDLGNGYYRNPIIPADYSDPDIIRVGNDYYGIASTFCFSPGMIIIHSRDLVNWEIIGHVVDDISFLQDNLDWSKMNGYYYGIWAGSLRYHDGLFYCHFCTPRGGWFVATAKDIRGKWHVQAMKDSHGKELRGGGWDDVCPLWDDDGNAYIIGSNFGREWYPHLFKMSADGTTLLNGTKSDSATIKNMDIAGGFVTCNHRTGEANKIYKWNGMYYLYFSEVLPVDGGKERVPVMLRSKNIYGPYERKVIMHSQGRNVDREPNQGAIIDTPDGKWYFVTQFGSGDFEGRDLNTIPVVWKDGWPMPGDDLDGDSTGEMTWQSKMPIKCASHCRMQSSDSFKSHVLSPQWEWNHQPRNDKWSLNERKGWLRLHAFAQVRKDDFFATGNVLSQRYTRYGESHITVKMDVRGMADGQTAGLAIFNGGKDFSYLAVEQHGKSRKLVFVKKQIKDKTASRIEGNLLAEDLKTLLLNTKIDFDGHASYSWSTDGKVFHPLGDTFQLAWGNYRGCRIGMFTFNNLSDKGYADWTDFKYTH
jgi:beta-xylosidase